MSAWSRFAILPREWEQVVAELSQRSANRPEVAHKFGDKRYEPTSPRPILRSTV